MPYPISIIKTITFRDKDSANYQRIVEGLSADLSKVGCEIKINDETIGITRCIEFSSRTTSLKEFNRGRIELRTVDGEVKVCFCIYVVEHLIFFLASIALGVYGFFDDGVNSVMIKIALLLAMANFVFCYLFPLMALNSFIHIFINNTLKNE
jgi:hypothetical protein